MLAIRPAPSSADERTMPLFDSFNQSTRFVMTRGDRKLKWLVVLALLMSDWRGSSALGSSALTGSAKNGNGDSPWTAAGRQFALHKLDLTAAHQFSAWVEGYLSANTQTKVSSDQWLAEGQKLAVSRRSLLKELIQTDPRLALSLAITPPVRQQLPEVITQHLEERVSGFGFFSVLVTENFDHGSSALRRQVRIGPSTFEAHVYGKRLGQISRRQTPLFGIALDGEMAVHEDPIRELDARETVLERAGRGLCPVCGKPADSFGEQTRAQVGDRVENFCSRAHFEQRNAQLTVSAASIQGAATGPPLAAGLWTLCPKTLLFMRVAFSDDLSEQF